MTEYNNDIVEFFKAYGFPDEFMKILDKTSEENLSNLELPFIVNATIVRDENGNEQHFTVNSQGDEQVGLEMCISNQKPLHEAITIYLDLMKIKAIITGESSCLVESYGFESTDHFLDRLTDLQNILEVLGNE